MGEAKDASLSSISLLTLDLLGSPCNSSALSVLPDTSSLVSPEPQIEEYTNIAWYSVLFTESPDVSWETWCKTGAILGAVSLAVKNKTKQNSCSIS